MQGLNLRALTLMEVHLPCCMWYARAESVGKLPHQVVVDAIFQRPQYDHRPRELEIDLLHGFVR